MEKTLTTFTKKSYKSLFLLSIFILSFNSIYGGWEKIETIPEAYKNEYFLEVYFLPDNPDYGWVCGYNGAVLRTTDRGESWEGFTVPYNTDMDWDGQLESIMFLNENVGYTSGPPGIYKSTDGGVSWRDVTPDNSHRSYWGHYFLDENYGVIVGGGCSNVQRFYLTTDGGNSWILSAENAYNTGLTDVKLYQKNGLGYAVSSGWIWITRDGGRSWEQKYNTGSHDWHEELAIYGNTFLLPASSSCAGSTSGPTTTSGLRISTDDGVSWRHIHTGGQMFGAFLIDEQHGWVCGMQNTLLYTSDGGETWIRDECGLTKDADFDDLWFIDDTTGFVVGDGIFRTKSFDTLHPFILPDEELKICGGEEIQLYTSEKYGHYLWSTGETSDTITVSKAGDYFVIVANTECDSSLSQIISIEEYPEPDIIEYVENEVCEGDTFLLSAYEGFMSYSWQKDGVVLSESSEMTTTSGGEVILTVIDTNGCTWEENFNLSLIPSPKPDIYALSELDFCIDDSVVLKLRQDYPDIQWYEDSTASFLDNDADSLLVGSTGYYKVLVTDENGCKGESGMLYVHVRRDTNALEFILKDSLLYFDTLALTNIACIPLRIKNIRSKPISLEKVFIYRNIEFSVPQSQFPITIAPYDSVDLEVCFAPFNIGYHKDTIIFFDRCTDRLVTLEGNGTYNTYEGTTRCQVPIEVLTDAILGQKMFATGIPYPNPASYETKITYFVSSTIETDLNSVCIIYNSMGEKVASGRKDIKSRGEKEGTFFESGFFIIDTKKLQNGAYYMFIKSDLESKSFPLIINK